MSPPSGSAILRSPVSLNFLLTLAAAAALAGCSALNLGPQPDNYIGPSRSGSAQPLTDPALRAVIPAVAGDLPGGGVAYPKTQLPSTMPSATQPVTNLPAATQAAAQAAAAPQSQPALGPSTGAVPAPPQVPQSLSVQDAILTGLQNNVNLRIQRYSVPLARTNEEQARARFDPTVDYSLEGGRNQNGSASRLGGPIDGVKTVDSVDASASITEFLPTGTTITANVSSNNGFFSESASTLDGTLSVTQSLLRGAGLDVNLASLREAEVNTKISQYEFRAIVEQQVATTEEDYWRLAFAERQVVIVENALRVAQEQLDSTNETIRVGRVADSERAAALAQVAVEKEDLISAKSTLETSRLNFLQALTPSNIPFWNRTVTLTTLPFIPTGTMDPVDDHAGVALRMSPLMNEARLRMQNGDLEIVRTKNGLLPRLDLFATLGKSSNAGVFIDSFSNLNGPNFSAVVGVQGDWEPINRAARASYRAAELTRAQLQETLNNQAQTIELDVRNAYIQVETSREQIDATRATREANEASLSVEQGKFVQGRSTNLLVAQAQQNLLVAQLNELQAVINHLIALVELYRIEGSLLYRRGLNAPGMTPVDTKAWH